MKRSILTVCTAAVLAASPLSAVGAFAMDEELTMLEHSVNNEFAMLGITDYTMGELTLGQLAAIKAVTQNGDYSSSEKKNQIEVILDKH
jgi:hypothetical protein